MRIKHGHRSSVHCMRAAVPGREQSSRQDRALHALRGRFAYRRQECSRLRCLRQSFDQGQANRRHRRGASKRPNFAAGSPRADIAPGADWGSAIIDAISNSRIMVLIFPATRMHRPRSCAKSSVPSAKGWQSRPCASMTPRCQRAWNFSSAPAIGWTRWRRRWKRIWRVWSKWCGGWSSKTMRCA